MEVVNEKKGTMSLTGGRRKNIFYELSYWANVTLKHNLDVASLLENKPFIRHELCYQKDTISLS